MPNDTAGPEGAAKAVASAKAALAESHKHFGDNPTYAPKDTGVSHAQTSNAPYHMAHSGGHEPIGGTTAQEINNRRATADAAYKSLE